MLKESPPTQKRDNRISSHNELLSSSEIKTFNLLVPKHRALAINPDTFAKKYSPEKIANDKKYVRERKQQFKEQESESTKRARVLEAIMAEQIELSDWFGSDTLTIIPAEYDDLHNGIDMLVEFAQEPEGSQDFEYLALGIDITSSAYNLDKKLGIIKDGIFKGTLTEMAYFDSERDKDAKPLKFNIPKVVIGIERQAIQELSELWMEAHQAKINANDQSLSPESRKSQKERARKALNALAEHRVRYLILEEIKLQIETYLGFARRLNKTGAITQIESSLVIIKGLSEQKDMSIEDEDKNRNDFVFKALIKELGIVFSK